MLSRRNKHKNEVLTQQRVRLISCLTRLLGRKDIAEEVAQETYLKLHRIDPTRQIWDWAQMITVATRTAIDRMRYDVLRARSQTSFDHEPNLWDALSEGGDPSLDAARQCELTAMVERSVSELHPSLREVITLRFLSQMSRQEVADELHISVGAVEQRLTRALTHLRQRVRALFGDPPY